MVLEDKVATGLFSKRKSVKKSVHALSLKTQANQFYSDLILWLLQTMKKTTTDCAVPFLAACLKFRKPFLLPLPPQTA